ncbi:PREDICTED: cysteine-rich venom protein-like [Galeopterus variegatus]|uniref:Cysteine-rich venom protein-like n=1 Tax=Galeopterus variegatus TaxID=482537 RepID=A0ABM0RUF4_GALVR|nr:PREDICTED: cysteine-rich venom protein-like [Galeopterus variegatus]
MIKDSPKDVSTPFAAVSDLYSSSLHATGRSHEHSAEKQIETVFTKPPEYDDISLPLLSPQNEEVQNIILDLHNKARSSVIPSASNMLKMVWSSQAAASAQGIADTCKMESSSDERQVEGKPCGENIFQSPKAVSWESVFLDWNSQKLNFLYGIGANSPDAPIHSYTQNYPSLSESLIFLDSAEDQIIRPGKEGNKPELIFVPYDEGAECGHCPKDCDQNLCSNPCRYYNKGDNCETLQDQCNNEEVKNSCEATCQCNDNEII